MEKNFDARALLSDQSSFVESEFEAKRESQLRKALSEARKALKKGDWAYYWAYLNQAAGQAGFDTPEQEEIVLDQLDSELRGMASG